VHSLRELQRRFVSALLWENAGLLTNEITADGIEPVQRLQIYRNNARIGFLTALETTFPVVARLGGKDWFNQTVWRYQQQHPSFSGDLHHAGELFADYLARELSGSDYEYFADVARLEWIHQEVLIAADSTPLDFSSLQSIPAADHAKLRFRIAPAARWVRSRFPLLAIWQANQPDADETTSVDLGSGPSNIVAMRRNDHVELRECSDAECVMLQALANNLNLEAAAARFARDLPDDDFSATLLQLAQRELIVDFSIDK